MVDLREQFPNWPVAHANPLFSLHAFHGIGWKPDLPDESEGTLAIAARLGIRHARFVGLSTPYIYTTDQLVTIQLPGRRPMLVAISIKYRSDLRTKKTRRRTFQKLRLEREYWRALGVPWLLITEQEINPTVCKNLEWCLSGAVQRLHLDDVPLLKRFILAFAAAPWNGRCLDHMTAMAKVLDVGQETAIRLLKLAIWRSLIPIDLTRPIGLQLSLPKFHGARPVIDPWSPLKSVEGRL